MPRARFIVGYSLIAVVVLSCGWGLWQSVPFDFLSYSAWAGVFLALASLLSLPKPPKWLGIRNRTVAGCLLVLGVAMTTTAVMWPAPVQRVSAFRHRIDDFVPVYQFVEYHEARTKAPLSRVVEASRRVSLSDMPAARFLMRLRDLADGRLDAPPFEARPLLDEMIQPGTGFLVLDVSDPRELVYGMVGRPWTEEMPPKVSSAAEFQAFTTPGQVRVAFDIRIVDEGGGVVRVSTETRIVGNDDQVRRVFARYWRLIYPGSAIIRRVWLDAIVARAEQS